jgi:hypothetical protein
MKQEVGFTVILYQMNSMLEVKSFDFKLLDFFSPVVGTLFSTVLPSCCESGIQFHVLESLKDKNQHSAKQFI